LVANDVQDRFWEVCPHSRKDGADETRGCVDIRRMSKVAHEEQAQGRAAKWIERVLSKFYAKWDSYDGRLPGEFHERLLVPLGERYDGLNMPDYCPFKPLPGPPAQPIWQPGKALVGLK